MKLTLRKMGTGLPTEAANCEIFEREVSVDEALAFLGRLSSPQDIIYLTTETASVDVWRYENSLWVEIDSDQLWATSEVTEDETRSIIETLYNDDVFATHIPFTNREWDAYAPLEISLARRQGAT